MQQGRYNNYHNTKRQLVGYQPGLAAPAWKTNQQARKTSGTQAQQGSKILLSRLPPDVSQDEVEVRVDPRSEFWFSSPWTRKQTLFVKTVGPVKEAFIVYNNQANSKGMAIITFQRSEDAMVARKKYNGKIIDGRRPIKIEIIKDEDEVVKPAPAPPTLLDRIGLSVPATTTTTTPKAPAATTKPVKKAQVVNSNKNALKPRRQKKGPKRLKKTPLTAAELDAEMEEYRAHA
ncbi:hypothetical protein EIP86_002658 [Pleurotus ostreatoroseus]|nr:hypothetical protein EIP86_002658 [Pleurotus ostreatoroseus]